MNAKYYFNQAEKFVKQNKDHEAKAMLEKAINMATIDQNLPILIPANYAYASLLLKEGKEKEAQGILQFIIDKTAEIENDWHGVFDLELSGAKKYFESFYNKDKEEKAIQTSTNNASISSFEELKDAVSKMATAVNEYISGEDFAKILGNQEYVIPQAVINKDKKILNIGKKAITFNSDIETVVSFEKHNLFCVLLCNIEQDGSIEMVKQPVNNLYCLDVSCKILWSLQGSVLKRKEFCLDIRKVDENTIRAWTISKVAYDIDVTTMQITKKKFIKGI